MSNIKRFGISRQIFIKVTNIKFRINPSADIFRRTEGRAERRKDGHMDGQTNTLIPLQSKRALLLPLHATAKNKTRLGLQIKSPIFLLDFNQICIFSPYFHKSPQHQIPHNPPYGSRATTCRRADTQTDGSDESNRRFSRLCERI